MLGPDLAVILPEIVLSLFAMGALLGAVYTSKDALAPALTWGTALLLAIMGFYIMVTGSGTRVAFSGMFVDDAFARFAKVTILFSAAAVLLIGQDYMMRNNLLRFEYPVLVVLSVVGMMMMVSSGDLIALYMGLELQSLSLYVIASLRRDSVKSTEAGLKYFILGALSSGLLLFGASLVYGFAGTTQFTGIIASAQAGDLPVGLLFGLVFVSAGLAFKVSAAPFHMWTPDVYEGSPTAITALFATAPKVAAMALFARVVHDAFGGASATGSRSWPSCRSCRCSSAPSRRSGRRTSSG
jgi:NADH-quinone oxidoreductase subunit N